MMTCFSVRSHLRRRMEALDQYQTLPYTRILPGYGAPGAKELFAPDAGVHDGREKEY